MSKVYLALLPGLACYVWFFGIGVLIQCLLSVCFALILEAALLTARGRDRMLFLKDGSVLVTALLFALMITPYSPWWISLAGTSFGLIFAKHLYGGLGQNLFNPAATGFVFVLLCFPVAMNHWPAPDGVPGGSAGSDNILEIIFLPPSPVESLFPPEPGPGGVDAEITGVDAVSGATPLANMQNRLTSMAMVSEIRSGPGYGLIAGKGWEWVNLGFMIGGLGLIMAGVISWRIPAAMLGGMFISGTIFSFYDPEVFAPPLFHLFSGGTMLGAFFVATDPVTASTTPRGRLIYGCLVGVIAYFIRVWGAYPDGVAFAVLIGNSMVPFIDRLTRPRVLGER